MGQFIAKTSLSETLSLSECSDGLWLYDKTRRMNLAMRAKSSTDALVEALHYYQERLAKVEQELTALQSRVDAFVGQFTDDSERTE